MRVLGIDFGEVRIGIAIASGSTRSSGSADGSSPARFAVPLQTLERTTDRVAIARIAELAEERDIEALVVGLPLGIGGERNDACQRVERFATKLSKRAGLPVYFVNESLTSHEASTRLRQSGARDPKRSGSLDALSATILLQDWIDQQLDPSLTNNKNVEIPG